MNRTLNCLTVPIGSLLTLVFGLVISSANAAIVLDAFTDGASSTASGPTVTLAGFDATASDKLVVLAGAASSFPSGFPDPGILSVTYNSIPMLTAAQGTNLRTAGVYYLDSASFSGAGDIVVTFNGAGGVFSANGFDIGAFALSGTQTGFHSGSKSNLSTASILIGEAGSFVAAVNSYGATPLGTLTPLGTDQLARGYEQNVGTGIYNATFSAGQVTALASFAPLELVIPEPSTALLSGLGFLLVLLRRRRA